jgi:flavorubredoxin
MTAIIQDYATSIDEIEDAIYRINTPIDIPGAGGFSFNQYLIVDDEPLLFHSGPRRLFDGVRDAIARVMPVERLRYVGFAHFEADECGALNSFLAAAPRAEPVCSKIAAMVSVNDYADRPAHALADGEVLPLGRHRLRWIDAPHLPHGWENGYMFEEATGTLLCGDLFTQPGAKSAALTESDILGPSEAFRHALDYYAHARDSAALFAKLTATRPRTLACMHGSAWRGDGAALIAALADSVVAREPALSA